MLSECNTRNYIRITQTFLCSVATHITRLKKTLLETDADELDEDEGSQFTMELFGAFAAHPGKKAIVGKKRDMHFIYAASARARDMLYDKGFHNDALKNIAP